MVLVLLAALCLQSPVDVALGVFMSPFLTALILIDLRHMILPNALMLAIFAAASLWLGVLISQAGTLAPFLNHLGGGFLYMCVSWSLMAITTKVLKKEALGYGDIKFFALAGFILGVQPLATFLILSGVMGVAFGLAWKIIFKHDVFPFGPALISAFYLLFLMQNGIGSSFFF